MLEFIEEMEQQPDRALDIYMRQLRADPEVRQFYIECILDESRIMSPTKVFKLMRYYKIEDSTDIAALCEIGDFAVSKTRLLRLQDNWWTRHPSNGMEVKMGRVKLLTDTYNKLKNNIRHKAQYKILRNALILMNDNDIKWFVRIICGKYTPQPIVVEAVRNGKV
jgi:hypothetical protein